MNAAVSASVSQIGKQKDNPKPAELSQKVPGTVLVLICFNPFYIFARFFQTPLYAAGKARFKVTQTRTESWLTMALLRWSPMATGVQH